MNKLGIAKQKVRAKSIKKRKDSDGSVNLLALPRRKKILAWIEEEGSARVRDLSEVFQVTEATIRQDLERLEKENHVIREHGGAFLKSMPKQVQSMSLQNIENMEAKKLIGLAAAKLVTEHETIIIDSGSTTTEFAQCLVSQTGLNVITNALNIALLLGSTPSNTIHMPGGQFKAPTLSLSGEKSGDFFNGIFANKLFLATAGLSYDAGLTYPALGDIYVKKAMIKAASEVFLLADSTKINKISFSSLGPISMIQTLVTDSGISDEDIQRFNQLGVKVIVAEK